MLSSYQEYVVFLSTLQERLRSIRSMKFKVYQTSATKGVGSGTITFDQNIVLSFNQQVNFKHKRLARYGYVVYQAGEKLYYYDSQPHPHIPSLAATHPHHKHVHPDLKHNRIPAPGLSFDRSNLEFLIREIEATLL
jgi:hypothetical protein